MPTVPTDQNRVSASSLPSVRSTVDYSPDTFGAGVGRVLQSVAGNVSQIAQAEQQKQDMAVLMGAERELQDWENKALFTPETGAYAQRGRNAFGLTDSLMPEYDKTFAAIESRLTERQKEVFRQRAGGKRADIERGLMRHIGQEAEQFQKAETTALVGTKLETAMLYASDPKRFDQELRAAQETFMAGNSELPPAALAVGVKEIESRGRSQVVGKLLEGDPLAAQRYFDEYRDTFTAADAAQLERVLRPAWVEAEGRRALASVKSGGLGGSANWAPKTEAATAVKAAADELGIDAVDLATVISYETGGTFDPDQKGPTTKWGQHKGLIQFGEPQRAKYGVRDGMTVAEQMKAVVAYLKDAGVKPGMGIMDVYSAINAGAPGRYNASDTAAGGAPGTVADKVNNQMAGHRAKAQAMFDPGSNVQAVSSPESAAAMIPRSKADVLAALNNIPNPEIRRAAMQAYKMDLEIEEVRKTEETEQMVGSINEKVEAADPALPLRQVLSPMEYAWAAENGKLAAWESRMANRLQGLEPKTDPAIFDAIQTTLTRAENGDTVAMNEVRKMDPTALFTKLDRQARDYVQNRRSAIIGAAAKQKDALPDFASEDELLSTEVYDKLGIPKTGGTDDEKATRYQFLQTYWSAIDGKQKEVGRKLTATERQAVMKDLLLPFARSVKDKYAGFIDGTEEVRGFELGAVPQRDRAQIIEAYQRVHGITPSDAAIRAEWMRAQGYTPQVETE